MSNIEISAELVPGVLGRLVEMHALYYAREWGFGPFFESKVAREVGEFALSLPRADSQIWHARRDGRVVGAIAIDGHAASEAGAHLRWFILDDDARGTGLGAALLDEAVAFSRESGFESLYLWTFEGLHTARRLYEARGFRLALALDAESWGVKVREQKFVLNLSNS